MQSQAVGQSSTTTGVSKRPKKAAQGFVHDRTTHSNSNPMNSTIVAIENLLLNLLLDDSFKVSL
jgi:hypothetical protein